ncbi:MAG TPA: hypothetical protein PKN39_02480 [Oscillospiraceae bacterium]|nr:hypothetical protein [Oscillospiraceae bacterium]
MIDGVPYAAGSGYLLKAISSFLASYPTYSDFVSALVAGTLPIDISFNSAGWSTQPTPLNKANLLDDTVATTLKTLAGLSSNPATPNAALSALATAVAGGAKIATGSYTGNGLYGSSHPCSLTFPFVPALVFILDRTSNGANIKLFFPQMYSSDYSSGAYADDYFRTWNSTMAKIIGKTLYWRSDYSADMQTNNSGAVYTYYAIG